MEADWLTVAIELKNVGFNLWHLWSHNKLLLNARFFGEKEAPCEKTFAILSIQICVGCFQSHSKSVWTQLLRRHIVLSSWQKMEHQNQAVGSVAQCYSVWMSHVATALTEMLFVKHFLWFSSCLSRSLVARSKTTSEFLVPAFYFSRRFQLIFHILLSFMSALFVDTEACRTQKYFVVILFIPLKLGGWIPCSPA